MSRLRLTQPRSLVRNTTNSTRRRRRRRGEDGCLCELRRRCKLVASVLVTLWSLTIYPQLFESLRKQTDPKKVEARDKALAEKDAAQNAKAQQRLMELVSTIILNL